MNLSNNTVNDFIHKFKKFLKDHRIAMYKHGLILTAIEFIESGIITAEDMYILDDIVNDNITSEVKNTMNDTLFIYDSIKGPIDISVYSFIKFNLMQNEEIKVVMPRTKFTECSVYNLRIYVCRNGQKYLPHITINDMKEQVYSAGFIERVNEGFNSNELVNYISLKSIIIQEPFYLYLTSFYSDAHITGLRHKKNKLMNLLHVDSSYMNIINQIWMDNKIPTIEKPFLRYQSMNNSIIYITIKSLINDISNDFIEKAINNNMNRDLRNIVSAYLLH